MAKIAYLTNGMVSTANSSLEFSRRLVAAGHSVIYASHADLAERFQAHGYDFTRLTACQSIREGYVSTVRGMRGGKLQHLKLARQCRQQCIASDELTRFIERNRPDALLIDIEFHYAVIATRRFKLPTALPISWFSIFRAPGYPPLHTTLRPPTNSWQSLRIEWEWSKLMLQRCWERLPKPTLGGWRQRLLPFDYDTNQLAALKAVARHHQVRLREIASSHHWLRPHLYRNLRVFSMNAAEMDFAHDRPSTLTYVGPMVLDDRRETGTKDAEEDWQSFVRRCRDEHRKVIYVSLGTYWATNADFLTRLIQLVERRSDLGLIVGLGGKLSADHLHAPPHVLVMDYAPQVAILKEADAAITHGGITSINECLRFGVPMLVCCADHVDQPGCAARVQYHGVGVVAKAAAEITQLATDLDRVLNDEAIQERVKRMQDIYQRYRDDGVAEQAVERLLSGEQPKQP